MNRYSIRDFILPYTFQNKFQKEVNVRINALPLRNFVNTVSDQRIRSGGEFRYRLHRNSVHDFYEYLFLKIKEQNKDVIWKNKWKNFHKFFGCYFDRWELR